MELNATDPFGKQVEVSFEPKPDTCPMCHQGIEATLTAVAGVDGNPSNDSTTLSVIYRCPRQTCCQFFIAIYRRSVHLGRGGGPFRLQAVTPWKFQAPAIEPEIAEVSPQFVVIYGQAAEAESRRLDQIAGMGFRKALEFLVKDYCSKEHPEDAAAIRAEKLVQTISKRVSDLRVKECATRAAWLGNDETHYERRWEGKDIEDLKILIRLIMHWISSSVLTKHYMEDMPPPTTK